MMVCRMRVSSPRGVSTRADGTSAFAELGLSRSEARHRARGHDDAPDRARGHDDAPEAAPLPAEELAAGRGPRRFPRRTSPSGAAPAAAAVFDENLLLLRGACAPEPASPKSEAPATGAAGGGIMLLPTASRLWDKHRKHTRSSSPCEAPGAAHTCSDTTSHAATASSYVRPTGRLHPLLGAGPHANQQRPVLLAPLRCDALGLEKPAQKTQPGIRMSLFPRAAPSAAATLARASAKRPDRTSRVRTANSDAAALLLDGARPELYE